MDLRTESLRRSYLDWLPMAYWYYTRLQCLAKALTYCVFVIWPMWFIVHVADASIVSEFVVAWLGFMAIYELGYIHNDYYAQPREIKMGVFQHKPLAPPRKTLWFVLSIVSRVPVTLYAVGYQLQTDAAAGLVFTAYYGAIGLVFYAHNMTYGSKRIATFFVLYWLRNMLPAIVLLKGAIVGGRLGPVLEAATTACMAFATAHAFGFTWSYGIQKRLVHGPNWLREGGALQRAVILMICAMVPEAVLLSVLGPAGAGSLVAKLVFMMTAGLTVLGLARLFSNTMRALRRSLFVIGHCHTAYSSDGELSIEDYLRWVAKRPCRRVYLTDHAEDVSEAEYGRILQLTEEAREVLVPGLEVPVDGQHILAIGLTRYLKGKTSGDGAGLVELKKCARLLVWAHPKLSMRRVCEWDYWKLVFKIITIVDGLEIYNMKNGRRFRDLLDAGMVALFACTYFSDKSLWIGQDIHTAVDLKKFELWVSSLERSAVGKMVVKGGAELSARCGSDAGGDACSTAETTGARLLQIGKNASVRSFRRN